MKLLYVLYIRTDLKIIVGNFFKVGTDLQLASEIEHNVGVHEPDQEIIRVLVHLGMVPGVPELKAYGVGSHIINIQRTWDIVNHCGADGPLLFILRKKGLFTAAFNHYALHHTSDIYGLI